MFDLGWTELLLIGIVALIVVGPKDLPVLFRNVGRFVGKARGMAREFSRAMEQAADETGVKEATKGFKDMTSSKNLGLDGVEEATKSFKNWSPDTETGRLSKERAEQAKKIHDAAAQKALERQEAERRSDAPGGAEADAPAPAPDAAPPSPETDKA